MERPARTSNAYFSPASGDHSDPPQQKFIQLEVLFALVAKLLTRGRGARCLRLETGATAVRTCPSGATLWPPPLADWLG